VILGFGKYGRLTYLHFQKHGADQSIYAFCSNEKKHIGTELYGKRIISVEDLMADAGAYVALVPVGKSAEEMKQKLSNAGFPARQIFSVPKELQSMTVVALPASTTQDTLWASEQTCCPVCGCKSIDQANDIGTCPDCGHGFRTRIPKEIMAKYYEKKYWEHDKSRQVIMEVKPSPEWDFWLNSRLQLLESFGLLDHSNPGAVRILEFGCAEGMLLYALKQRGYQVMGNEIGAVADEASKELGIEISRLPIEEFSKSGEKFDLIMSFHVLEHLRDPREVMKNLSEMLSPGGFLLMHVPVNDAEYDNTDHYHFFSHESCMKLMEMYTTDIRSDVSSYEISSGNVAASATYVGRKMN